MAAENKGGSKSLQRIVVYVRRKLNEMFVEADFSTCLMDYFHVDGDVIQVAWTLQDNKILLQPADLSREDNGGLISKEVSFAINRLQHPVYCAVHHFHPKDIYKLPKEIVNRGVDVGVSIILESQEGHVLITRRASHMRTFPNVWVPPGGHMDLSETVLMAGLRELEEETGLALNPDDVTHSILGLWESVFPPALYVGDPRRHHFVIYMHMQIAKTSKHLQTQISLDPLETDAYLWLDRNLMDVIINGTKYEKEKVDIVVCKKQGEQVPGKMSPKVLSKKMPLPVEDIERLSTGTRYALKLLLKCDNMEI